MSTEATPGFTAFCSRLFCLFTVDTCKIHCLPDWWKNEKINKLKNCKEKSLPRSNILCKKNFVETNSKPIERVVYRFYEINVENVFQREENLLYFRDSNRNSASEIYSEFIYLC